MDELISKRQAIDALCHVDEYNGRSIEAIRQLPPAELSTNLAEVGTDCISRQAAIDALRNYLVGKNVPCDGTLTCRLIENEVISKLPSVQPEIIRCKDCKYWDTTWQNDYAPNYHYCPMIDSTRRNDFYCADAERRTDG